jgi:hypothetical protein
MTEETNEESWSTAPTRETPAVTPETPPWSPGDAIVDPEPWTPVTVEDESPTLEWSGLEAPVDPPISGRHHHHRRRPRTQTLAFLGAGLVAVVLGAALVFASNPAPSSVGTPLGTAQVTTNPSAGTVPAITPVGGVTGTSVNAGAAQQAAQAAAIRRAAAADAQRKAEIKARKRRAQAAAEAKKRAAAAAEAKKKAAAAAAAKKKAATTTTTTRPPTSTSTTA